MCALPVLSALRMDVCWEEIELWLGVATKVLHLVKYLKMTWRNLANAVML